MQSAARIVVDGMRGMSALSRAATCRRSPKARMTKDEGISNDIMRSPRRASRIGEHTRPACGSLRPRDDELLWEVRDGGTPSLAPETGGLPSNVDAAGRMPARLAAKMAALLFLALTPISTFGISKNCPLPQLAGYKAVPVHYGPLNKMIMSVQINGQPADLLVDTGANEIILDADAAQSFGVRPSQRGLRYIRRTQINGQLLFVGFAQNLNAGSMNFGGNLVALRNPTHSGTGSGHVDGVLGLDILLGHKAVINCRTKLVFFKVDPARQMNLSAVATSQKFTRIPLRREENGALTVPCSIRGESTRLVVDTGAFVTTFDQTLFKSLGIASEPTRVSARFASGAARRIGAGRISDLKIGDFKVPPEKFGVTALPDFALRLGATRISGILGMDTLYICHAIIDLDGMNLYLK
jgi:predicted aspartyl protease